MCGARVQIGGRQKRIDKIQNKKINVKQTPHKTSKNNFKFKSSAKNLMSDKKKIDRNHTDSQISEICPKYCLETDRHWG